MSPEIECILEELQFDIALANLDPEKHLEEKEDDYVMVDRSAGNFFLIRENEDGWWFEAEKIKGDANKRMQEYLSDKTVAYAWIITHRFTGRGGWCDPNG